jgi:hypothetical protein
MSTIAIDKDALRIMIREAVQKKLGTIKEGAQPVAEMKSVANKSDKDVLKAFLAKQPAQGTKLGTDGQRLDGLWMGGTGIAEWQGDKIYTKDLGSKSAQIVQRALSKMAGPGMVREGKTVKAAHDNRKSHDSVGKKRAQEDEDKMAKKELDDAKKRLKEAALGVLGALRTEGVTPAGSQLGKKMAEDGMGGGVPGAMAPVGAPKMEGAPPAAPPAPAGGSAGMPMEAGKPTVADPHAAEELRLYMENDFEIWEGNQKKSILKNLALKMKKGKYDSAQAPKLWLYLVDAGAQKYVKEFGSQGDRVDSLFNKATRMQVASEMAQDFEREVKSGEKNLDALIAAI